MKKKISGHHEVRAAAARIPAAIEGHKTCATLVGWQAVCRRACWEICPFYAACLQSLCVIGRCRGAQLRCEIMVTLFVYLTFLRSLGIICLVSLSFLSECQDVPCEARLSPVCGASASRSGQRSPLSMMPTWHLRPCLRSLLPLLVLLLPLLLNGSHALCKSPCRRYVSRCLSVPSCRRLLTHRHFAREERLLVHQEAA